jgi:hypothetical protein
MLSGSATGSRGRVLARIPLRPMFPVPPFAPILHPTGFDVNWSNVDANGSQFLQPVQHPPQRALPLRPRPVRAQLSNQLL